ncbi:MAG: hypothetical protein ACM3QU_06885 [Verrucomicrobiota bacterium]
MKIGVLAVQGTFREHAATPRRPGAEAVEVRLPEELEGLAGLFVVASRHPELTEDTRVHELFLDLVREETNVGA